MSKHPPIATMYDKTVQTPSSAVGLLEILDRVLDKGVVVCGDLIISIADVDLIGLNLNLFLASIERVRGGGVHRKPLSAEEKKAERAEIHILQKELEKAVKLLPRHVRETPEEAGLAKLVLTLIELLKELMERQALRRMERGSLREEEIERMGLTFELLEKRLEILRKTFGLKKKELHIDLGPLGVV